MFPIIYIQTLINEVIASVDLLVLVEGLGILQTKYLSTLVGQQKKDDKDIRITKAKFFCQLSCTEQKVELYFSYYSLRLGIILYLQVLWCIVMVVIHQYLRLCHLSSHYKVIFDINSFLTFHRWLQ